MKKIIRHPVGATNFLEERAMLDARGTFTAAYVPHDSEFLYDIAGAELNKRLRYSERFEPEFLSDVFTVSLSPSNPSRTSLYQRTSLSKNEIVQAKDVERLKLEIVSRSVSKLLDKAMEDVHTVHVLKNSFWQRLKFLFKVANPTQE